MLVRARGWLLACALVAAPQLAFAQEPLTISGRITDEAGQPLPAASISIPELALGVITNPEGRYQLTVPAARVRGQEATLAVQLIGYRAASESITVTGGTLVRDFALVMDPLLLQEVVVTGLGQTMTRERLGVSISSVSGEDMNRVPTPNVVNALAAKAPGVEIISSAGDPGAASFIRIRGVNTVQGSGQPLFVVDGVPVDNSERFLPSVVQYGEETDLAGTAQPNRVLDLNPADIASVEILKGAAASAIYGARAANGVVLITTRRGEPGPTVTTLSTSYTIDQVNRGVPLQRRFGQGLNEVSYRTVDDFPANLRSWGPELSGQPTFDHWGELFEDGRLLNTDLSVSGANDRIDYFLSVGRSDHDGVVVGSRDSYDRTSARLRAGYRVTDEVTVTGNFFHSQGRGSFVQKGSNLSGLLLGGLRTPPDFDNRPYLSTEGWHRSYTNPDPEGPFDWWFFDNPFFTIEQNRNTSEVARTMGSLQLEYRPLNWLDLTYQLGNDHSVDHRVEIMRPGNYTWVYGYLGKADFRTEQLNHTALATARHRLSPRLGGTATVGYERNIRKYHRFFVEGQDFVAPNVPNLDNTITRTPNEYRERVHSESYFGQVTVDLAEQVFLTGALRHDGFSTFGESERRHLYPKASAAWEFTRMIDLAGRTNSAISYGKLRAAWGEAGNEPPVYGTIGGYTAADVTEGWNPFLRTIYAGRGGLYTDITKSQPDLKPERTRELELGLDLNLLRDRTGLGITFYDARTRDAILLSPLAPSTGFFQQLQNAATFRNRGWEVTADVRAMRRGGFGWDVGANWSTNSNRVLDLGDPDREFILMGGFSGVTPAAIVGERIGVFRGNDFYRCGNSNLPSNVESACQGQPRGAVFIGQDGFPVLDPTARVIGDPHPDWLAGLRNTFTYGPFQLFALLDMKKGGDVWNGTRGALYSYGVHRDTEVRGLRSTWGAFSGVPVTGPGADTEVTIGQDWFLGLGSGFGPVASQFIEDGGFVKLREVALTYSVPGDHAARVGMSRIDLRLAGRNLKTWTDYTGIDPETNLTGTSEVRGYDYFNNPGTRQWVFSLGLTR